MLTSLADFRSLTFGGGIEVQIKSKFRECFQCHGKQEAVFFHAGVVTYHAAKGGNPARQIAVNRISLLLENARRPLILLLSADAPIVIETVISPNDKQAAVVEEGIVVQIAMANGHLQIGHRLNSSECIHFRKALGESWPLGVDRKRHPRQRREADSIK